MVMKYRFFVVSITLFVMGIFYVLPATSTSDQQNIEQIKQEVIDSVKDLVRELKGSYEKEEKTRAIAAIKAEMVRMKELRESMEYSEFITKIVFSIIIIVLSVYIIKYGTPFVIDYLHEREQAYRWSQWWSHVKSDLGF